MKYNIIREENWFGKIVKIIVFIILFDYIVVRGIMREENDFLKC